MKYRILLYLIIAFYFLAENSKFAQAKFTVDALPANIEASFTTVIGENSSHPNYPSYSISSARVKIYSSPSNTLLSNVLASLVYNQPQNPGVEGTYTLTHDISSIADGSLRVDIIVNPGLTDEETFSYYTTKYVIPPVLTIRKNPDRSVINEDVLVKLNNAGIHEYKYKIADWQGNFPSSWTGPVSYASQDSFLVAKVVNKTYNQKIKIIAKGPHSVYSNEYNFSWNMDLQAPVINSNVLTDYSSGHLQATVSYPATADIVSVNGQWFKDSQALDNAFSLNDSTIKIRKGQLGSYYFRLSITDQAGNISNSNSNSIQVTQLASSDIIDKLTYSYLPNSNRLQTVTDSVPASFTDDDYDSQGANQFAYDANGNTIKDLNRNINSITYNHQNLPTSMTVGSTNHAYRYNDAGQRTTKLKDGKVKRRYLRDASGKLIAEFSTENSSVTVNYTRSGSGTLTVSYGSTNEVITANGAYNLSVENSDYSNSGIVFAPSNGAVELTAMDLTDGELSLESINLYGATDLTGQRRYKGGGEEDVYYLKDHLGNIRTILKDEKNNPAFSNKIRAEQFSLLSARDYFPFGSTMRSSNFGVKADVDKWRYQGKELDSETNYFDFGARLYDPATGRFLQVDPMSEKFVTMNSYMGMFNNPIRIIDPTGMEGQDANCPEGDCDEDEEEKNGSDIKDGNAGDNLIDSGVSDLLSILKIGGGLTAGVEGKLTIGPIKLKADATLMSAGGTLQLNGKGQVVSTVKSKSSAGVTLGTDNTKIGLSGTMSESTITNLANGSSLSKALEGSGTLLFSSKKSKITTKQGVTMSKIGNPKPIFEIGAALGIGVKAEVSLDVGRLILGTGKIITGNAINAYNSVKNVVNNIIKR